MIVMGIYVGSSDGQICSPGISTIAETDRNGQHALSSFNDFTNRFLAVWVEVDGPVSNVLGRFLNENSETVLNAPLRIWTFVDDSLGIKSNPCVAWLRSQNRYLVTWGEQINSTFVIMARSFDEDGGSLSAGLLVSRQDSQIPSNESARVASNERDGEFVVGYTTTEGNIVVARIDGFSSAILGETRLNSSGADSQPHLIWSQSQGLYVLVTRHLVPGNNHFDLVVRRLSADLSVISQMTAGSFERDEQMPSYSKLSCQRGRFS